MRFAHGCERRTRMEAGRTIRRSVCVVEARYFPVRNPTPGNVVIFSFFVT